MGPDAEALAATARQAERLKKDGNEYYRRNRFGAAIDAYTEVPGFFANLFDVLEMRCLCSVFSFPVDLGF